MKDSTTDPRIRSTAETIGDREMTDDNGDQEGYFRWFDRALLVEGNPKDVRPGLRGEPVTHWNLILPQIICYIVVLKVLKLRRASSAARL